MARWGPTRCGLSCGLVLAVASVLGGCSEDVTYGADARERYVEGCQESIVERDEFDNAGVSRELVADYCRCAYDGFAESVPIEEFEPYADGHVPKYPDDDLPRAIVQVIDRCVPETLEAGEEE